MTILSIRPAAKEITYVLIKNDKSDKLDLIAQGSLKLAKSTSRTADIADLYKQLKKLMTTEQVNYVLIKASVVSQDMTLAHLQTAELRGSCVIAATTSKVQLKLITPAATFAKSGKVKETLKNDDLFERNISGELPKTKRDLALLVINHLDRK